MKLPTVLVSTVFATVLFATVTSFASSPFKKAFDAKYVKDSGNAEFQAAFKKMGCYTCHVKDKKKDFVNAYGWELSKLIEGNAKDRVSAARKNGSSAKKAEEGKLLKELEVAMDKAEALKAASGEAYGELFKTHKLPSADGEQSVRK
ncbi:MAG: hypothetical protein QGG71_18790 [Pirellulaceae bacterium]|jgi:hypothetical protein|nr:hypothetical protein [Pirellulaceae bacterium]